MLIQAIDVIHNAVGHISYVPVNNGYARHTWITSIVQHFHMPVLRSIREFVAGRQISMESASY